MLFAIRRPSPGPLSPATEELGAVRGCATEPHISFLLPMFNGLEFTRACLRSLEQTVPLAPHEVILIDDASTDGTAAFLETVSAPFRVLRQAQRSGYAAAMNHGAAAARGEILCLLNNDLVLTPGWLPPMLRAFDRFPDAGMIGNIQLNLRTGRFDHMGLVFGGDGLPIHFGEGFRFRPFRGFTEWRAVTAACCLVRKSVFLGAGGFDEAYRNGCEDVDLCLTLGRQGRRHYVANSSVIGHHVSASEGRALFNSANEQLLLQRWRGSLAQILTPRERRRFAANYLLRVLAQPAHYHARRFRQCLYTLLKCGH